MKIHYVSGSRADFGLMRICLERIHREKGLELAIVATGQHLLQNYGNTYQDIVESGIPVVAKLPVVLTGAGGAEMALALARELDGFVRVWQRTRPDLVLVLGDRGEMLAATLAAVHLGIHVAHIHGGERSGTLDESFRHAISKMAHFHFPATLEAATRLQQMGEEDNTIYVIGAPGLCELRHPPKPNKQKLLRSFGLQLTKPVALVVFHPVVQEQSQAKDQIANIIDALDESDFSQIILKPNSDAGGASIDQFLETLQSTNRRRVLSHLPRSEYVQTVASCDVVVGNSSSGIIESASLGVRCLNIGSRQNGRERNTNTVDCSKVTSQKILQALQKLMSFDPPFDNRYGDGRTDELLVEVLAKLKLDPTGLQKMNSY